MSHCGFARLRQTLHEGVAMLPVGIFAQGVADRGVGARRSFLCQRFKPLFCTLFLCPPPQEHRTELLVTNPLPQTPSPNLRYLSENWRRLWLSQSLCGKSCEDNFTDPALFIPQLLLSQMLLSQTKLDPCEHRPRLRELAFGKFTRTSACFAVT